MGCRESREGTMLIKFLYPSLVGFFVYLQVQSIGCFLFFFLSACIDSGLHTKEDGNSQGCVLCQMITIFVKPEHANIYIKYVQYV